MSNLVTAIDLRCFSLSVMQIHCLSSFKVAHEIFFLLYINGVHVTIDTKIMKIDKNL